MASRPHNLLLRLGPPALSLTLLSGLLVDKVLFHEPGPDTGPYHAAVANLADGSPYQIGEWVGVDVPVPREATALLRPNKIISRRYEQIGRGLAATLLLVHCRDARDMEGHYPPRCYPGQGWRQVASRPAAWSIRGMEVVGTEYEFTAETFSRSAHVVVDNFMVLPDGRIVPDLDGVIASAKDYRKKFLGAAQVQVVFDAEVPEEARREAFATLVGAYVPLIQKIRMGANP